MEKKLETTSLFRRDGSGFRVGGGAFASRLIINGA